MERVWLVSSAKVQIHPLIFANNHIMAFPKLLQKVIAPSGDLWSYPQDRSYRWGRTGKSDVQQLLLSPPDGTAGWKLTATFRIVVWLGQSSKVVTMVYTIRDWGCAAWQWSWPWTAFKFSSILGQTNVSPLHLSGLCVECYPCPFCAHFQSDYLIGVPGMLICEDHWLGLSDSPQNISLNVHF